MEGRNQSEGKKLEGGTMEAAETVCGKRERVSR